MGGGFEFCGGREVGEREESGTKVSPLSFVRFTGRPAGIACSKIGRSPVRAALKRRVARSMASGVREGLEVVVEVVDEVEGAVEVGEEEWSMRRGIFVIFW